ncbi:hypothetical protein [Actinokineospora diospyrosa]|uniref:hypothetical protein n=1 Tax=Actinokineospora diospyrosa TaxID=103728 RepID=UPI0020A24DFF|nr:hypothetical protein [Actinokineospora diospyrosa]
MDAPPVERLPLGPERWLVDLPPPDRSREGCPLSAVLPPGYARYLRLFSPFRPWDTEPTETSVRQTWRHFAAQAGAIYHAELDWYTLRPVVHPDERPPGWEVEDGRLDPLVRAPLCAHLARHSPEPVFLYFGLAAEVLGSEPLLYRARVDAIEAVLKAASQVTGIPIAGPEYIWPQDRAWIVETDYDLTSSYLACDTTLATELLADDNLELLPVTLDSRIDNACDRLNPRPKKSES